MKIFRKIFTLRTQRHKDHEGGLGVVLLVSFLILEWTITKSWGILWKCATKIG